MKRIEFTKEQLAEIKVVAIDLDDTLLHDDGTVSEYSCEVIERVRQSGREVVLATGRMYDTAAPVAKALKLDTPMILYSGAVVQRPSDERPLFCATLPKKEMAHILALCEKNHWYVQVYTELGLFGSEQSWQSEFYESHVAVKIPFLGAELYKITKPCYKLLIIEKEERVTAIQNFLVERFSDSLCLVRSKPFFLEIMSKDASKGQALLDLAGKSGVRPEQIVAFGNSENDASMLALSGLGIAVANADPAIRDMADEICASNEDDGVAQWLEKNLLIT